MRRINLDAGRFGRLIIVDSIPHGELNTAQNLRDDLHITAAAFSPTPALEYVRTESAGELLDLLQTLRDEVKGGAVIPALHIECHGDLDGFVLADGVFVEWDLLKTPLTELNVATELNLFITVAACVGGALAKVTRLGDRAPYWGLIGPAKDMMANELEVSFRALYSKFFETRSAVEALAAFEATTTPGTYLRTTAQGMFEKAWRHFKETHATPDALEARAESLIERQKALLAELQFTQAELVRRFKAAEPVLYRRYVETYFMCDLYPGHRERFQPTTEQVP